MAEDYDPFSAAEDAYDPFAAADDDGAAREGSLCALDSNTSAN